jgi:hypothetical protein
MPKPTWRFAILRIFGFWWMLSGAAASLFVLSRAIRWGGEYLQCAISFVLGLSLLCGGYGLAALKRWGRAAILVEMPLVALWAVGWLFFALQNRYTVWVCLFTAATTAASVTFLGCLCWSTAGPLEAASTSKDNDIAMN